MEDGVPRMPEDPEVVRDGPVHASPESEEEEDRRDDEERQATL
jgi:hypothetical protein